MPREANSPPKGVTRRRTTRTTTAKTTTTTRRKTVSPRARAPGRVARKAPTPIQATAHRDRKRTRLNFGVFLFCVLSIGGSITYGMSDKGAIDPGVIITERNERVSRGESVESDFGTKRTVTVPVQGSVATRQNSTAKGMGDIASPARPAPAPEPQSDDTASSSDDGTDSETASSTDSSAETGDVDPDDIEESGDVLESQASTTAGT